ncbi:MAG TPA: bifunctional methionine sulfoxide reductase B/A protein [Chitinophagaceae bacterium]|jgi:peptide methionine sulfoxide reductase msrA/msrB|nr:bifunctional methionine sulfoxide reductase B/A protein [Chitinophagaceae bacterium]
MNWNDVLNYTRNGPAPDRRVTKSEGEWKQQLTPEQYRVTRQHGTEAPFTGEHCATYAPGIYACVCCGTELFDATRKFDSRTGWPSFTEPVKENVIGYRMDTSYGMQRVEVLCNVCDAHLGHVFPDGPPPTGLRFCINSASLQKAGSGPEEGAASGLETATMGGGCFWCTEALLDQLKGVESVESGYAGGVKDNPTYREVCNGGTGHAEVVQVRFDPRVLRYSDLLRVFMLMHNPTTLNRQGADEGTQYRSVIFYHNEEQQAAAEAVIREFQPYWEKPIVTQVAPYTRFYKAEEHHQQYYRKDPGKAYCQSVINPKLARMKEFFREHLKTAEPA